MNWCEKWSMLKTPYKLVGMIDSCIVTEPACLSKSKSCCNFKYFSLSSATGSRTETTRCCKRCGVTSKFSPKKMRRMRRSTLWRDRSQEPPSSDPKPEEGFPTGSLWWGGRWSVTALWDWSLDRRSQTKTRTSNMCRKRSYLSELSWM